MSLGLGFRRVPSYFLQYLASSLLAVQGALSEPQRKSDSKYERHDISSNEAVATRPKAQTPSSVLSFTTSLSASMSLSYRNKRVGQLPTLRTAHDETSRTRTTHLSLHRSVSLTTVLLPSSSRSASSLSICTENSIRSFLPAQNTKHDEPRSALSLFDQNASETIRLDSLPRLNRQWCRRMSLEDVEEVGGRVGEDDLVVLVGEDGTCCWWRRWRRRSWS